MLRRSLHESLASFDSEEISDQRTALTSKQSKGAPRSSRSGLRAQAPSSGRRYIYSRLSRKGRIAAYQPNRADKASLIDPRSTWIGMRSPRNPATTVKYAVIYTKVNTMIFNTADISARSV